MIEYIIRLFLFLILSLELYKDLISFQQNQYYTVRYFKTLRRKLRFVALQGVIILGLLLLFQTNVITLIFIVIITFISYVLEYNKHYKVKFKFTPRMKRISGLILFATLVISIFTPLIYLAVVLILINILFILFHFIMYPIEANIRKGFVNKARKKLEKVNLNVVGITGSYGKTSSKNILFDILKNNKYTLATPASYNTPMGLSISINNDLTPLHEVFIAEMGAYKIGDIQENCDIVHPNIAIVTSIGNAHLESFGSSDNILSGKFELVESLPTTGLAVLNADDSYMMSYQIKNKCKVLSYSIDNESDLKAYNLSTSIDGMKFNVTINNKEYLLETKLLGKHNVYNILACILVALHLEISVEDIVKSVKNVNVITHRLELRKELNYTIIDDAFNSNPVGAREAAITLGMMDGYRVAMTPGMIELGEKEFELNKQFGFELCENSDYIIIVGKNRSKPFEEAFSEVNFTNYIVVNNVDEGFNKFFTIVKENKVLLIENDLPDIY